MALRPGTWCLPTPEKNWTRCRSVAGLKHWSQNGLRHSFASYRLAATSNAAAVAAELGHSTSQMLYSTYRELVLPEEAERYWRIVPAQAAENVIAWRA